MSTTKRIAKRLLAVVLTVMMLMSMVTIGMASTSAANVELAETGATITGGTALYMTPNSNWTQADARFAAYFFNSSTNAFVSMTKVDDASATVYKAIAPSGSWTNVIFCRMNPASSANNWDSNNLWNQTNNLTWDGSKNLYTIAAGAWTKGNGSWSTYTEPAPAQPGDASSYYLMGTLTDWATGKNMVHAEDTSVVTVTLELAAGEYKFKVKSGGSWMGNSAFTTTLDGGTLGTADIDGNVVVTLTGGTYTFNYSADTAKMDITYTAPVVETTTVAATTTVAGGDETTDDETPVVTNPAEGGETFTIDWATSNGLYAYAGTEVAGTNAWQRWDNVSGKEYRYFYLPASASDTEVVIYNTYSKAVTINGVEIPAGEYKTVTYKNGEVYTCTGATTTSVKIMKSDAEGTLFINSADGMTTKNDAGTKSTVTASYDLYAFLTSGSKNQEAGKAAGAVADANGVDEEETTVKKIKGRGNSTWKLSKKPFNITYNENIQVDGMKGKKWSLLANAQDPSLLRNRLVYDLANEVDMTYACDSRFVDWFVNGDYKGSYQLTQKIEMGKNTVMPDLTEPEVEDVVDEKTGETIPYPKSDFDFILELDTKENAASSNDKGDTTKRGQWMTFKTPDDPAKEQWDWMMSKYQAVEDALYTGNIATLETLVDLDDFARAYLVNEVAKNLDAGVTSCYFTYNSETGKFTTAPVWDYDNALGNSVSIKDRHDKDGKMLDVTGPTGWYARDLVHYDLGTLNVFGQACATTGKNAAGETFNDVVLRIWNAEFLPAIAVLEGTADSNNGRLTSVAGYMANLKSSGQWNYNYGGWELTANNGWVANHSSLVMYDYDAATNTLAKETKSYDQYTLEGQANYAGDWMISRMNWMAAQYADAEEAAATLPAAKDGYMRIFFTNEWMWSDVKIYIWGGKDGELATWPGAAMTLYENNGAYDVYYAYVPTDAYFLFNGIKDDGTGTLDKSPDIKSGAQDGLGYAMTWNDKNDVKTYTDYIDLINKAETTTSPAETTTAPAESSTAPVESSTAPVVTDPDESTEDEEKDTLSIYFENNWKWADPTIYFWTAEGEVATWPGVAMTKVDTVENGDRYVYEVPADVLGIIFAGGGEQSTNIESGWYDGICYYMTWDEATQTKPCASYKYEPVVDEEETTVTTPAESSTAPAESSTAPADDTSVTIYAINSAKWDAISAYAWINGGEIAWPGTAMTKTGETVNGFDVYTITFDTAYTKVIFNNNNKGSQTDDLTVMDGQYYDIKGGVWYNSLEDVPPVSNLSTDRYLVGSFNSWSTVANEFKLAHEGGNTGYVTLTLDANTTYEFKVVREGAWTSCDTPITGTVSGLTFSSGVIGNAKITTTEAGEYTFAFGISNSQLSVTYPTSTPSTGDEDVTDPTTPTTPADTTYYIHGEFNGWKDIALEGEGTVISATTEIAAGTYKFKIYTGDTWYGNDGTIEDTCEGWTFKTEAGDATLVATGGTYTFTFDTETKKLTITAEIVTPVYNVTANEGNFTVNAPATVEKGANLEFTVDAAEGYKVAAVIVDMNVLTAVDGVYTVENVTGDVSILVIVSEDVVITDPEVMKFTVEFQDKDGNVIDTQTVEYGKAATAPEAPTVDGYKFTGWSEKFDFVTYDLVVKAKYSKIVEPVTTGKLQIEITGGTSFTIEVNEDGKARPQGTSYYNTKAPIGASITVVANTTNGNEFLGWMNSDGAIVSTTETYKFNTSGNDYLKAVYKTQVEGVSAVIFKNTKAAGGNGQILDMQYYAAGDEITFPAAPSQAGYDFTGWSLTAEQIEAELQAGKKEIEVEATWERAIKYVTITVEGGTINGATTGTAIAYTAATVVADAAADGMKFAYWTNAAGKVMSYDTEYKFFPAEDIALKANYVAVDAAIEYKALAAIAADPTVAGEKIQYTLSWDVPAEVGTFVSVGIILIDEADYNPDTFYHGSGDDKLFDRATAAKDAKGSTGIGKGSSFYGHTYYAATFLVYKDAQTGENVTIHSDTIKVEKLAD